MKEGACREESTDAAALFVAMDCRFMARSSSRASASSYGSSASKCYEVASAAYVFYGVDVIMINV